MRKGIGDAGRVARCSWLRRSAFVWLALVALCAACTTHQRNEREVVSNEQLQGSQDFPAVEFNARWSNNGSAKPALDEFAHRVSGYVLRESKLFESVERIGRTGSAAPPPLRVDIRIDNHGSRFLASLSGFVCGLTLFIIPGYARDGYLVTAKVSRGGAVLGTYEADDSIATWLWIGLAFTPQEETRWAVVHRVLDNNLRAILAEVRRDLERETTS